MSIQPTGSRIPSIAQIEDVCRAEVESVLRKHRCVMLVADDNGSRYIVISYAPDGPDIALAALNEFGATRVRAEKLEGR